MIIWWILVAIFIGATILLTIGKGGFLIAGYNTMSNKEKEEYDVKKLSRIVGIFVLIPCDMLVISLRFMKSDGQALLIGFIFIVYIIVTVIVFNVTGYGRLKK